MNITTCSTCGWTGPEYLCGQPEPRTPESRIFGTWPDGRKDCELCCANHDRQAMITDGRAVLYLTLAQVNPTRPNRHLDGLSSIYHDGTAHVGNWPGSLKFKLYPRIAVGYHNMAGRRYDVWFPGPDGFVWHGVQFGDMTQICHCKRTKERM